MKCEIKSNQNHNAFQKFQIPTVFGIWVIGTVSEHSQFIAVRERHTMHTSNIKRHFCIGDGNLISIPSCTEYRFNYKNFSGKKYA